MDLCSYTCFSIFMKMHQKLFITQFQEDKTRIVKLKSSLQIKINQYRGVNHDETRLSCIATYTPVNRVWWPVQFAWTQSRTGYWYPYAALWPKEAIHSSKDAVNTSHRITLHGWDMPCSHVSQGEHYFFFFKCKIPLILHLSGEGNLKKSKFDVFTKI